MSEKQPKNTPVNKLSRSSLKHVQASIDKPSMTMKPPSSGPTPKQK